METGEFVTHVHRAKMMAFPSALSEAKEKEGTRLMTSPSRQKLLYNHSAEVFAETHEGRRRGGTAQYEAAEVHEVLRKPMSPKQSVEQRGVRALERGYPL